MEDRLIVTASPHIHDSTTTATLMGWVLVALLPSAAASAILYGPQALVLMAVTTGACVIFEHLYCVLMKKPSPVGDLSACVTGVILAMNMPAGMPLWIAIIGAFVAIVIVKQLFGGLGYNFANPALVGRMVLFLGFSTRMTTYVFPAACADTLASATPLSDAVNPADISLVDMFLGIRGGMLGEGCAIAILAGLVILLYTGTIEATIPCTIMGVSFMLSLFATGFDLHLTLVQMMGGGLFFGAVFMATDYVTSPLTRMGKIIYGVCVAVLAFLIRNFTGMNEGMSYALLLGNILTCLINMFVHQTPLGYKKPAKAKKAKEEKEPATAGQGGAA